LAGNESPAINYAFSENNKDVMVKASASICVNSESVSIEIDKSELQHEKHVEHRIVIRREIVIDLREEELKKSCDSRRVNSEPVSNEIDESEMQYENYDEQRI
jgi:hypothetical protein